MYATIGIFLINKQITESLEQSYSSALPRELGFAFCTRSRERAALLLPPGQIDEATKTIRLRTTGVSSNLSNGIIRASGATRRSRALRVQVGQHAFNIELFF